MPDLLTCVVVLTRALLLMGSLFGLVEYGSVLRRPEGHMWSLKDSVFWGVFLSAFTASMGWLN